MCEECRKSVGRLHGVEEVRNEGGGGGQRGSNKGARRVCERSARGVCERGAKGGEGVEGGVTAFKGL